MIYAGFWTRVVAAFIDSVILTIVTLLIVFPVFYFSPPKSEDYSLIFAYMVYYFILWLYMTLMESSESQATFGKRLMKLKVTDGEFNKISFGKANIRFFSKLLSYITLTIGFLMSAFTKQKQGLHDLIASTYVVQKVDLIKTGL